MNSWPYDLKCQIASGSAGCKGSVLCGRGGGGGGGRGGKGRRRGGKEEIGMGGGEGEPSDKIDPLCKRLVG